MNKLKIEYNHELKLGLHLSGEVQFQTLQRMPTGILELPQLPGTRLGTDPITKFQRTF